MRLSEVLKKLPPQTELIAVSKKQSIEKILELYRQGQKKFGENYVQELIEKSEQLKRQGIADIEFHFIGKLQRNKVKALLPHVQVIHSIDSLVLLNEVEKQAAKISKRIKIYAQINIDQEVSKGGFTPDVLGSYANALKGISWIQPIGLMAIPDPEKDSRDAFARMKKLSDEWKKMVGSGLSMGMSSDFETAIQSGATSVRIGTALFGERKLTS